MQFSSSPDSFGGGLVPSPDQLEEGEEEVVLRNVEDEWKEGVVLAKAQRGGEGGRESEVTTLPFLVRAHLLLRV